MRRNPVLMLVTDIETQMKIQSTMEPRDAIHHRPPMSRNHEEGDRKIKEREAWPLLGGVWLQAQRPCSNLQVYYCGSFP